MRIRKTLTTVAAAVTLLLFSSTPAHAVLGGSTADAATVADSVVNLENGACTGVMISPSWALTAKHCTDPDRPRHPVTIGVYGDGGTFTAQTHRHPGADLALLNINGIHDGTVAALPSYHAAPGHIGQIVGFGGSGRYIRNAQQAGLIITQTFTDRASPYVGGAGTYHAYETQNGDTAFGDSGGPIFLGDQVHGIHAHNLSEMTAVSEYLAWIEEISGVPAGSPAGTLDNTGPREPGDWQPLPMSSGIAAGQIPDAGPADVADPVLSFSGLSSNSSF